MKFAAEHKIPRFFEVSAKTGYNVEEPFSTACKEIYLEKVIGYSGKEKWPIILDHFCLSLTLKLKDKKREDAI